MLILGIETSCDETAAAVVEDGRRVRSSVVATQAELHAEYGGVVPEIASRAHLERILPVIRRAVADAGLALRDIDAVAVGHRPGLIGSLLVGLSAAKALAWGLGKPLIGVDHVQAHLYAGLLDTDLAEEDVFPAVALVVSGGHTALYDCRSPVELTRVGSTIDDALGEAYDKAATILGLPYPGGPNLDRLAAEPGADDRAQDFPVSRLGRESLDFSFSGLKTSMLYAVRGVPRPKRPRGSGGTRGEGGGGGGGAALAFERDASDLTPQRRRDLAASFQRAAVQAVILKLTRLLDERPHAKAVVVGGGVSANSRLRAELAALAGERELLLVVPPMRYCVDNAAMIAGLAYPLLRAGEESGLDLVPVPTTAC